MRKLALTVGMALLLLTALGCGGHKRSAQITPSLQEAPAAATMTEGALIAQFYRRFPDAEKRPAELMNPEKTVVDDLTAELITEDEQGQPLDPPLTKLSFSATNYADYNNDTVVDIKDLTPLAARFNLSYNDSPTAEEILSSRLINGHPDTLFNRQIGAADGNGDGAVNISDLTPIAANFNSELSGYNIYRGEVIDSLLTWSEVPLANLLGGASSLSVSIGEWTDEEEARTGQGATAQGRLLFELTTEAPPEGETYGFRASAFGHGEEGPHGNAATVSRPSTEDTTPPFWLETVGITELVPQSHYKLEVRWGEARDGESPPVVYRVYYAPSDAFSLETATVLEVQSECSLTLEELEEDREYAVVVRARDSAVPPNEDDNMVTLAATTTLDITPPAFDEWGSVEISARGGEVMYVRLPRAYEEESEIASAEIAYRVLSERPEPPFWAYLFDDEDEPLPETQLIHLSGEEYLECARYMGQPVSIEGIGATDFLVASLRVTNSVGLTSTARLVDARMGWRDELEVAPADGPYCYGDTMVVRDGNDVATVYIEGWLPNAKRVSIGPGILPDEAQLVFDEYNDPDAHSAWNICDADGIVHLLMDKTVDIGDVRISIRSYTFQGDAAGERDLPLGDLIGLSDTCLSVDDGVAALVLNAVAPGFRLNLGSIIASAEESQIVVYETEDSYPCIPFFTYRRWNPPIVDSSGRILVKAGDDTDYDQVLMLDPTTGTFESVFPYQEATKDVLLYRDGALVKMVELTSAASGPALHEYRLEGSEFVLETTVDTQQILAAAPWLEPGDHFTLEPSDERYILSVDSGYETLVDDDTRWHTVFSTVLYSPAPEEFIVWHQSGAKLYSSIQYPLEDPMDILFNVLAATEDEPPEWRWTLAHKKQP